VQQFSTFGGYLSNKADNNGCWEECTAAQGCNVATSTYGVYVFTHACA
jgi:hypothetical protein